MNLNVNFQQHAGRQTVAAKGAFGRAFGAYSLLNLTGGLPNSFSEKQFSVERFFEMN
jgi:hypothetical protein